MRIIGGTNGEFRFICFAQHTETGEILLVCSNTKDDVKAIPWSEYDYFNGADLPVNRQFNFEEAAQQVTAPDQSLRRLAKEALKYTSSVDELREFFGRSALGG